MARDCEDCKKYVYDSSNRIKDVNNHAVKRKQPPNCMLCKKYDEETGKIWNGFSKKNLYIFESFLIAYKFKVLPRKGGIDEQDPKIMSLFILLSEIFDRKYELANKEVLLRLAARR
jgi:hypothetical protein